MLHDVITRSDLPEALEIKALRSDILDAFADLECLIYSFLKDSKIVSKAPHLGARLEAFKTIDGISRIAKANYTKRDRLADDISALLPIRADIVHSRIKTCVIDGASAARFVNSQNACVDYPPNRILMADELREICYRIKCIVAELGTLGRVTSPAPSLPPPSPAAAGGP